MQDLMAWKRTHFAAFLVRAGTGCSCGDSPGSLSDPRLPPRYRGTRLTTSSGARPDDMPKEHKQALKYMVLSLYALACQTNSQDTVVVFGRDMYPFLAMREAVGHKLRGKWLYAEGLSRTVIYQFAAMYKGARFGVDTGFSGTIPAVAITGDYEHCPHSVIALLSSSTTAKRIVDYSVILREAKHGEYNHVNGGIGDMVTNIENLPKPFMRTRETEVVDGQMLPIMRLASRKNIEDSIAIWDYTYGISLHYWQAFKDMLSLSSKEARTRYILERLNLYRSPKGKIQ